MAAVSPELEIIARIEAKGDAVLAELREQGADDRRILNHLALRMAENTEELREQRLAWRVEFRNQSEARRRDLDEERERWRLEVEARLEERREDREERREESEARREESEARREESEARREESEARLAQWRADWEHESRERREESRLFRATLEQILRRLDDGGSAAAS
jgi:hypothetical protein